MFETVTVDEALAKGKLIIKTPLMVIQVLILAGCIALSWQHRTLWGMLMLPIMLLSIAVYRSIVVPRWRIWAFKNVRNVHELKRRALKMWLLSPEGSIWEKLEWYTAEDKEHLKQIAEKFKTEDVITPDHTTASETRIYISRSYIWYLLAFLVFWLGLGIYFLTKQEWGAVAFFFVISLLIVFFGGKKALDKSPQIIINDQGMKTANSDFYTWDEIGNEDVEQIGEGRNAYMALVYDCPGGREEFQLSDLGTNTDKLLQLLATYRQRSGKQYKFAQNNFLTEAGRRLIKRS